MSKLVFYTNPMSRGRIVRWMLEEIGAKYETVILEYGTTMKADEYLAINPMGKVPTLVHNSNVVTETAAICAYLAEAFPAAQLLPENEAEKALYYRWLFFTAGPFEQAISFKILGAELPPQLEKSFGCGNVNDTFTSLAQALKNHDYIAGDRFTAADVYIGSQVGFGLQFGSLPKLPEFESYFNRIKSRPAKIRAEELDNSLLAK